jgi:hypothetical protein
MSGVSPKLHVGIAILTKKMAKPIGVKVLPKWLNILKSIIIPNSHYRNLKRRQTAAPKIEPLQPVPCSFTGHQYAINAAARWRNQMAISGKYNVTGVVFAGDKVRNLTSEGDGKQRYFGKTSFDDHDYTSHKYLCPQSGQQFH